MPRHRFFLRRRRPKLQPFFSPCGLLMTRDENQKIATRRDATQASLLGHLRFIAFLYRLCVAGSWLLASLYSILALPLSTLSKQSFIPLPLPSGSRGSLWVLAWQLECYTTRTSRGDKSVSRLVVRHPPPAASSSAGYSIRRPSRCRFRTQAARHKVPDCSCWIKLIFQVAASTGEIN